jgi:hypothetical protein
VVVNWSDSCGAWRLLTVAGLVAKAYGLKVAHTMKQNSAAIP